MRRSLVLQLALMAVVVGAIAMVVGLSIPWMPTLASKEGGRVDDLYLTVSVICLVIFAVVAAVSIYAVVKFRAKPGDDEDGKPIHGHTGLEVLWTAIPMAIVIAIGAYSGVVLVKNEQLPAEHRVVEVTAQQFVWLFTYPDLGIASGELHLPVGETVELKMRAKDVIHAFWVPEWRVKQDAVPGITTRIVVTPTKTGRYPVVCVELCGLGHSTMRSRAVVTDAAGFAEWVREQQEAAQGGGGTTGESVFANAGCGSCHALADAGASGQVGPDLDKVLPGQSADRVRESIVNPNAEISEGYQPDVMLGTYGDQLSGEQLDALVKYLVDVAGKGQ